MTSNNFLDFAIIGLDAKVKTQGKIGKNVKIIKQIWKVANQEIRDFMCCRAIDSFRRFGLYNIPALKTVIQEIEEHKRVMDLDMALRRAIRSLNVDQVKATLENCGTDIEKVLMREVHWNNGEVDVLLVYPLKVKYSKELNQDDVEKIKNIFKLMFDATSPRFLEYELNGNNYVMSKLVEAQERFAEISGVDEQCFQDLIRALEEKLSEHASKKLIEEQAREDAEHIQKLQEQETETAGNTTFYSEHKGKIALGVVGLCAAGAVAAYVLAYPVVALALTVLAAVILMGAGIAKVLEDPSVEKTFTQQQKA